MTLSTQQVAWSKFTTVNLGDNLIITISDREPDGAFRAWFGDYDLDCMTGWGKTRVAAASDLLDQRNERLIDRATQLMAEG